VFDILAQQTISNRPFGELAIELGYLNRLDLGRLLLIQIESSTSLENLIIDNGLMTQIELDNAVHERKLQRSRVPVHNEANVLPLSATNPKAATSS
jgi:hypothetical protein